MSEITKYDLQVLEDYIKRNIHKNINYLYIDGGRRKPFQESLERLQEVGYIEIKNSCLTASRLGCIKDAEVKGLKLKVDIDDLIDFIKRESKQCVEYLWCYRQLNGYTYENLSSYMKILLAFYKKRNAQKSATQTQLFEEPAKQEIDKDIFNLDESKIIQPSTIKIPLEDYLTSIFKPLEHQPSMALAIGERFEDKKAYQILACKEREQGFYPTKYFVVSETFYPVAQAIEIANRNIFDRPPAKTANIVINAFQSSSKKTA